jgi:hypothetical protein
MKITVEVPAQRIVDMLVGALEHNHMTNAWCANVELVHARGYYPGKDGPWYDTAKLFEDGSNIKFKVCVYDEENDGYKEHVVTLKEIKAGLHLMAKKHTRHFGDMLNDTGDNITQDVFFQCVVLNEVNYG